MIAVSTKYVPCKNGAKEHQINRQTKTCELCAKPWHALACPTCEHVYSHNVEIIDSMVHRKWICRVCLREGIEPMRDAQEYQILRGRKLAAGPEGGLVNDGPQPSMRTEFPASFRATTRESLSPPIVPWFPG